VLFFTVLIALILLIVLQSQLLKVATGKKMNKNVRPTETPCTFIENNNISSTTQIGPPQLELTGVDEKTAAMIIAIVCNEISTEPDELYFKSIKAIDNFTN
jgi:hypothetical protein